MPKNHARLSRHHSMKSTCHDHQCLPCRQTQWSLLRDHLTSTLSCIQQAETPAFATLASGLQNILPCFSSYLTSSIFSSPLWQPLFLYKTSGLDFGSSLSTLPDDLINSHTFKYHLILMTPQHIY